MFKSGTTWAIPQGEIQEIQENFPDHQQKKKDVVFHHDNLRLRTYFLPEDILMENIHDRPDLEI